MVPRGASFAMNQRWGVYRTQSGAAQGYPNLNSATQCSSLAPRCTY